MKLRHLFSALFLCLCVGTYAQMDQPLPMDPAVRTGKLDNGLTYYIRQNGWPEHRVNFYIAQRVGSLQENEDQRGLAHFLEHMCFNGTENFPGNGVIDYTRSLGVEFGQNLNAYTSIEETVYNINDVPSTRVEALDSCLLILKDWSNGLLLEADEIDKERGVIHEEWRLRSSAAQRMFERNLETLYPGSKYGRRMPIGLMEVVDNFSPQVLRDYYHKWYRPDNQAIVVVGDIDVDRTEAKIKELFAGIPMPADAAKVEPVEVPDNAEPIVVVDKDKEQQMPMISLDFKHDVFPKEQKGGVMYLMTQYVINRGCDMLNARLSEKAQEPDCPFIQASCGDGQYIFASTKDAFSLTVIPKEGKGEEALAAAYREALRAARHGFTATEYARIRSEYLSQLDKQFTNKDKRNNHIFGAQCYRHYLDNEPILAIDMQKQMMDMVAPQIPVDAINQAFKELVSENDSNMVILSFNTEKEGVTYPTNDGLLGAVRNVRTEQIAAYVDNVKDEPLIAKLPKKGKINKGEKTNTTLGYKELTLSNGARVILKKTDYKEDEIQMMAMSKGGSSLLGDADIVNGKLFGAVMGASGLGAFDNTELEKALAGKQASVSLNLSNLHETVSGNCVPKDIETMMQLLYLNFTDVRKDEKAYNSLIGMLQMALKNKGLTPEAVFTDSVQYTLFQHNPRFGTLDEADLQQLNYDRCLQIAKERFANAADFTFYFVGNFDEATLRPLIEQYIASLPGNSKKKEQWKPVSTYAQGQVVNHFTRKMETPKAQAHIYWYNNSAPYTLENAIMANAAAQVLDMIYIKEIREEASAAYSAGAMGGSSLGSDKPFTYLVGVCPFKPEKGDIALKIMREEAINLTKHVDADMLSKVKAAMLKNADTDAKKNGHWMDVITDFDETGIDKHTNYKQIVESLTPEKIAAFVKDVIFAGGNSVEVVMTPEE